MKRKFKFLWSNEPPNTKPYILPESENFEIRWSLIIILRKINMKGASVSYITH